MFVVTLTYIFSETRRVPTNDGADDLDQDEAELEGAGYRYAQHEGECSAQRRQQTVPLRNVLSSCDRSSSKVNLMPCPPHRVRPRLDDGLHVQCVVVDVDAGQVPPDLILHEFLGQVVGGIARVHEHGVRGFEKLPGRPLCPADSLVVVRLT